MELRQLAYFVAVAEEQHFTRAAERVSVAQPAVSQQIRRLEAELGEHLFVRDRRGTRLTPAGQALLPHARATLGAAEGARAAVAALSGLLTGQLTVGLVHPLPDRRFPQLLGAFRRQHPRIELTLIEDQTDALLAALAAGGLHAALIGLGRHDRPPPDLAAQLVGREPVVAAVHPSHPLARRGTIPLGALRDQPMVTLTRASKLRSTLESACQAAGFAPRIVAETSDLGVLVELVAEQVGVAVLPASGLAGTTGMTQLQLTHPKIVRRLLLVWPPATSPPAARAFLTLAREHLTPPAGST
jgi:DNA-binding transcriptional LysR family regulator